MTIVFPFPGGGGGSSSGSLGYSLGRTFSHSLGKVGGGTFYQGGIGSGAQDWRNQYSAKVANKLRLPWENRGVGGSQLCPITKGQGASPTTPNYTCNFASILQQTPAGDQLAGPFPARPGPNLYHLHLGANDLGFGMVTLPAFLESYRAVIGRLLSNVNIEDNHPAVTAAGGAAGTARTVADRNSGIGVRQLTNGQAITITGQPLDANFPGGDAWFRFVVETGDVNAVSIVDNGVTIVNNGDLTDVPRSGQATPNISLRQDIVFGGVVSGGTFTLSYGGQTTAAIAWNASPQTVQAALQALSSVGTGAGACPNGLKVRVQGNAGNAYDVVFDPATVVAGGTNCRLTFVSSLTGTAPTITIKEQAGQVAFKATLAPGAHTITITATSFIAAQPVQFDCLDIATSDAVPATIMLPNLHRLFGNPGQLLNYFPTWSQQATPNGARTTSGAVWYDDAKVAQWNVAILAMVLSEFTLNGYPRCVYVDIDLVLNKDVKLLGPGDGTAPGDGIHPLERGLRLVGKAILNNTPSLSSDEAMALGMAVHDDWQDLALQAGWSIKNTDGFFQPNFANPRARVDGEGFVHFEGAAIYAGTPADATGILNLPVSMRPGSFHQLIIRAETVAAYPTTPFILPVDLWPGPMGYPAIGSNAGRLMTRGSAWPLNPKIGLSSLPPIHVDE